MGEFGFFTTVFISVAVFLLVMVVSLVLVKIGVFIYESVRKLLVWATDMRQEKDRETSKKKQ